jgi:hypothetical protein
LTKLSSSISAKQKFISFHFYSPKNSQSARQTTFISDM